MPDAARRASRRPTAGVDIRVRGQRRGERDIVKATMAVPGEYAVSRPLDFVQIDHTQVDITVVGDLTRAPLPGRPWLPRHRRLLAHDDGASRVDECAITRVGGPVPSALGIRQDRMAQGSRDQPRLAGDGIARGDPRRQCA